MPVWYIAIPSLIGLQAMVYELLKLDHHSLILRARIPYSGSLVLFLSSHQFKHVKLYLLSTVGTRER